VNDVRCRTARGDTAQRRLAATIALGMGRINDPTPGVHMDSRRYVHSDVIPGEAQRRPGIHSSAPGGWVPDSRVPRLPG